MKLFHIQFVVLLQCLLIAMKTTVEAFSIQSRSSFLSKAIITPEMNADVQQQDQTTFLNNVQSSYCYEYTRPYKVVSTMVSMICLIPNLVYATTEVELTELPPPWIPVVFGLGLIVGVGLLTGSLGDVIEEESQLGLQSGARAKKEMDRTRSSYFKKK